MSSNLLVGVKIDAVDQVQGLFGPGKVRQWKGLGLPAVTSAGKRLDRNPARHRLEMPATYAFLLPSVASNHSMLASFSSI